jgi:hypothetical protein
MLAVLPLSYDGFYKYSIANNRPTITHKAGPLVFERASSRRTLVRCSGQADDCGHSTKNYCSSGHRTCYGKPPYQDGIQTGTSHHLRPFLLAVPRSVFAILVFREFLDEKRPIPTLAETLHQERAQVPLWGPAPVSGATFYRVG